MQMGFFIDFFFHTLGRFSSLMWLSGEGLLNLFIAKTSLV